MKPIGLYCAFAIWKAFIAFVILVSRLLSSISFVRPLTNLIFLVCVALVELWALRVGCPRK